MAKNKKGTGAWDSTLKSGERILAIDKLFETTNKLLENTKNHPIFKFIAEQFRELREEIITYKLINEMNQGEREKINKFLLYLCRRGETAYIQDLQNIVFTYVIFENVGVPLTQVKSDTTPKSHLKFNDTGDKKLLTDEAKKFLNELADMITNSDDETAYKTAMEHLSAHRMIGQHPFKLQLEKFWKSLDILEVTKNNAFGATSKFFKKQFPANRRGAFGALADKLRGK